MAEYNIWKKKPFHGTVAVGRYAGMRVNSTHDKWEYCLMTGKKKGMHSYTDTLNASYNTSVSKALGKLHPVITNNIQIHRHFTAEDK